MTADIAVEERPVHVRSTLDRLLRRNHDPGADVPALTDDERADYKKLQEFHARTVYFDENGINRTNLTDAPTASGRRLMRSNQDLVSLSTSVFAAVRKRTRAVTRPAVRLVRVRPNGDEVTVDDPRHPVKRLLQRVNGMLTFKEATSLCEMHKLTNGSAYWIKRRLGGPGTRVVEFEVWNPRNVTIVPEEERPWIPAAFILKKQTTQQTVLPPDVVYFRHLLDPRNFLYGLSPISAARVSVDTGLEASRYNQRFFDNDAAPSRVLALKEGSAAEAERLEQDLERRFQGTDKAHRTQVVWGDLELLTESVSQKDMDFMGQMRWGVEEVARAFEVAPVILGDYSHAAAIGGESVSPAMRDFWTMIQDQVDLYLATLTEFLVRPDFGPDLKLVADYSTIPELQEDAKRRAEIDNLRLESGVTTINVINLRDGIELVAWGDEPIMPAQMLPLSQHVAPPASAGAGAGASQATLPAPASVVAAGTDETEIERQNRIGMQRVMQTLFGVELRRILDHITKAAQMKAGAKGGHPQRGGGHPENRILPPELLGSYDWSFLAHEPAVVAELTEMYSAALVTAGYQEAVAITEAQTLAATYARQRGAELLVLGGKNSIVDWTRTRVRRLTAESILAGDGVRALKNKLRADFRDWTPRRAEMVARTELAFATGDATIKGYRSNGFEAKEWSWPGGKGDGVCDVLDGEVVRLDDSFSDGSDAPPAHPNCRCALLPVTEMEEGDSKKGPMAT